MIVTGFTYALTLAMLAVIYLDITRYLIPNSLNAAILVMFVGAAFFLPFSWLALVAASIILVVGLGFFALGLMGGGDIKLLTVLALWTGWGIVTLQFILLTALVGGVLVLFTFAARAVAPIFWKRTPLPRFLTWKQPVPYGIAIAGAFLLLLWSNHIPILAR